VSDGGLGQVAAQQREIFVGLTRETDDDVGANGGLGNQMANTIDQAIVVRKGVGAAHGAQDSIACVLQRQMEVGSKYRRRGHEMNNRLAALHRLQRTDAEANLFWSSMSDEGQELEK
jgi:hypothetical protein